MSLKTQIEGDIKKAMLAKDKDRLRALRAIKSMILIAETDKGATGDISSDQEITLLSKAAKQRRDSIDIYEKQGRNDLAEVEKAELSIINEFLPKQLSEEELVSAIKLVIEKTGATSMKEMGKVMGIASKELAGKADGKLISQVVKKLLGS